MKKDTWSASQYIKFEQERNRPIMDLITQIPTIEVNKAIDIGCGPGNSTELLATYFPKAKSISGIDSSADMIKAARERMPDIHFEISDISNWEEKNLYDIILANASLQWVPDHKILFPSLIQKLNKNGSLAVQMPDNLNEPTHVLMRKTASEGTWASKLKDRSKRTKRESADWYYQLLKDKASTLNIWRTTYFHPLPGGHQAIIEWLKGTGLRPFLTPLDQNEQSKFLEKYTAEIAKVYRVYDNGNVLLPFPRLFIVATR
jgi:trans-aconitate 2-methyltransferase